MGRDGAWHRITLGEPVDLPPYSFREMQRRVKTMLPRARTDKQRDYLRDIWLEAQRGIAIEQVIEATEIVFGKIKGLDIEFDVVEAIESAAYAGALFDRRAAAIGQKQIDAGGRRTRKNGINPEHLRWLQIDNELVTKSPHRNKQARARLIAKETDACQKTVINTLARLRKNMPE